MLIDNGRLHVAGPKGHKHREGNRHDLGSFKVNFPCFHRSSAPRLWVISRNVLKWLSNQFSNVISGMSRQCIWMLYVSHQKFKVPWGKKLWIGKNIHPLQQPCIPVEHPGTAQAPSAIWSFSCSYLEVQWETVFTVLTQSLWTVCEKGKRMSHLLKWKLSKIPGYFLTKCKRSWGRATVSLEFEYGSYTTMQQFAF